MPTAPAPGRAAPPPRTPHQEVPSAMPALGTVCVQSLPRAPTPAHPSCLCGAWSRAAT